MITIKRGRDARGVHTTSTFKNFDLRFEYIYFIVIINRVLRHGRLYRPQVREDRRGRFRQAQA